MTNQNVPTILTTLDTGALNSGKSTVLPSRVNRCESAETDRQILIWRRAGECATNQELLE
jgi:hypothetical protein